MFQWDLKYVTTTYQNILFVVLTYSCPFFRLLLIHSLGTRPCQLRPRNMYVLPLLKIQLEFLSLQLLSSILLSQSILQNEDIHTLK